MSSQPVCLADTIALVEKAKESYMKHNYTRAAECFARAAAQAEQLTGSKDNLISACLKSLRSSPMNSLQAPAAVSSADRAAIIEAMYAEVFAVTASLQRRRAEGTLLRATELELAFYDACVPPSGSSPKLMSGEEAFPGISAFISNALDALAVCVSASLSSSEAQQLFDFVADALDLIGQTVTPDGSPSLFVGPAGRAVKLSLCESCLINDVSKYEFVYSIVRGTHPEVIRRFDEARRRLSASPVLRVRNFAESFRSSIASTQLETTWHENRQRRVLRRCQLPACGKEELHPSQFKHCSGCSAAAVVYCCKERQVADWPSHKAACKAARKGGKSGGEQEERSGAGKKQVAAK